MKRDRANEEETNPETVILADGRYSSSIGATAAACLVGGVGEQSASAQQTIAANSKLRSRIVKFDAKRNPIEIDSATTHKSSSQQNDLRSPKASCSTMVI